MALIVSRDPITHVPIVLQTCLPIIKEEMEQGFAKKQFSTKSSNRKLIWYFYILSGAMRAGRNALQNAAEDVLQTLNLILDIKQKDCQKAGEYLVKTLLAGLWDVCWTKIQPNYQRDLSNAPEISGSRYRANELYIEWYIPESTVFNLGVSVVNQILDYIIKQSEELATLTSNTTEFKEKYAYFLRLLVVIAGATERLPLPRFSRVDDMRYAVNLRL